MGDFSMSVCGEGGKVWMVWTRNRQSVLIQVERYKLTELCGCVGFTLN